MILRRSVPGHISFIKTGSFYSFYKGNQSDNNRNSPHPVVENTETEAVMFFGVLRKRNLQGEREKKSNVNTKINKNHVCSYD